MNKLNDDEIRVVHNFNEYYKHLKDTHMTEGVTGISDPTEIMIVNAGIAAALTAIKGNEKEDYFA